MEGAGQGINNARVTLGICVLTEKRGVLEILKIAIKEGVDEVIIVTPNVYIIRFLTERINDGKVDVHFILEPRRRGKSAAINEILSRASGDLIVMASADVKLVEGAIESLVKKILSEPNIGAVDSNVSLMNKKNSISNRIAHITWLLHNLTMTKLDSEERLGHIAGDLYCIRRGIVHKIPDNIINDDAYIAMRIRLKGFKVVRSEEAKCYILGPQNPVDYLLQRSRVIRGHFQLLCHLRKFPTVLEFLVFKDIRKVFLIIGETIKHLKPSKIPLLFIAMLLEVTAIIIAFIKSFLKGNVYLWAIANSTKELFS